MKMVIGLPSPICGRINFHYLLFRTLLKSKMIRELIVRKCLNLKTQTRWGQRRKMSNKKKKIPAKLNQNRMSTGTSRLEEQIPYIQDEKRNPTHSR